MTVQCVDTNTAAPYSPQVVQAEEKPRKGLSGLSQVLLLTTLLDRLDSSVEACFFNAISTHCFVHSASLDRHSYSPVTGKNSAGSGYVQPKKLKAYRLKKPQQLLDLYCFSFLHTQDQ